MDQPDNPLRRFLDRQGVVVLDGGLATELENRGHDLGDALWSARLLFDQPEAIRSVHQAYLEAGADCLISATYQATFEGLERVGLDASAARSLLLSAVDLACGARDRFWEDPSHRGGRLRPLVAASIGPYGAYLADGSEYTGDYGIGEDELHAFHRRRLALLAASDADLLACESLPSAAEARALVRLLDASDGPPAWISFTCRDGKHISDGTPIRDVAAEAASCVSVVAVGVNCTAPSLVPSLIRELAGASDLPIVVYPNSGERWDAVERTWQGTSEPVDYAAAGTSWLAGGARLIGGCCRTGPKHVRVLRNRLVVTERGAAPMRS